MYNLRPAQKKGKDDSRFRGQILLHYHANLLFFRRSKQKTQSGWTDLGEMIDWLIRYCVKEKDFSPHGFCESCRTFACVFCYGEHCPNLGCGKILSRDVKKVAVALRKRTEQKLPFHGENHVGGSAGLDDQGPGNG